MNATPKGLDADYAELAAAQPQDTQAMATETTLLNPRFYTTDFDEMDRVDVTPVRKEWDALLAPPEPSAPWLPSAAMSPHSSV